MALVITAFIGAAVTGMLFSTSRATESRTDVRQAVVHSEQLLARLRAQVLASASFLAVKAMDDPDPSQLTAGQVDADDLDNAFVLLWLGDDNGDASVNLGELGLLEYDPDQEQTLRFYTVTWPTGWTPEQIAAANTTYAADAKFLQEALRAKWSSCADYCPYFTGSLWSTRVKSLACTLDQADPLTARLATLRVNLAAGDLTEPLVLVAGLRTPTSVGGS